MAGTKDAEQKVALWVLKVVASMAASKVAIVVASKAAQMVFSMVALWGTLSERNWA